jgi:hypothetical protein
MFVKFYYCSYSGEKGPPILSSRAAFLGSPAVDNLHAFQGASYASGR